MKMLNPNEPSNVIVRTKCYVCFETLQFSDNVQPDDVIAAHIEKAHTRPADNPRISDNKNYPHKNSVLK